MNEQLSDTEAELTELEPDGWIGLFREVWRRLKCRLGFHAWASHSDHLHFALGGRVWSVVETPCIYCRRVRRSQNDASPLSGPTRPPVEGGEVG